MAEEDVCVKHVVASSVAETAAISLDRAGDVRGAIARYEEAERELSQAIDCALPAHAEDQPKLIQHRGEVAARIQHLKSLNGKPTSIPVEDQIKAIQLGMQAHSAATKATSSAGGVKALAAVAALGAGAGLIVLGSTVGGTIAVVGGAAAAGYCATRGDKVGDVARSAGGYAVQGVEKARDINAKHDITGKLAEAGSKAVTVAKETDQKYGVTTKIVAGAGAVARKVSEIEDKHHVTDKVGAAFSSGLSKISSALEKRPSVAGGSALQK